MKKILSILMLFLCLVLRAGAQDFEPGQQAKSLLESKNVTVDYATGIFHYRVPLYTLTSGDYELPVSLDYTGKGVKMEDAAGPMGYNWTLNTGGVVTRTIRGGIADESANGYLNVSPEILKTNAAEVHKRVWDGECDIFTAVFNGEAVPFIVRRKQGKLYGEPLERNNVRIEGLCRGYTIDGWMITDETGNRYVYKEKEWIADINKEDAVSFNGVRDKSYVSSWYLSRIEPLNGEPVLYTYRERVDSERVQNDIRTSRHTSSYKSKYHYGRPVRERPFDFSKYQAAFKDHIESAGSFLKEVSIDIQWQGYVNDFNWSVEINSVPDFTDRQALTDLNKRIMGSVADLKNISDASIGLVRYIESLADCCFELSKTSINAYFAWEHLRGAGTCIFQMLNDSIQVTEKEVGNVTTYEIRSPLLSRIQCGDRYLEFSKWETDIRLCDLTGKRIAGCRIKRSLGELTDVLFLDKDSTEVGRMRFDYYDFPEDHQDGHNLWGFPYPGGNGYAPFESDLEYSRAKSLKSITLANQGKISIDYGLNSVSYTSRPDETGIPFGGIRIHKLAIEDNVTHSNDTIRYDYPFSGILVTDFSATEKVKYASFEDDVQYSRIKPRGFAFTKTGNEGCYYPMVQETIKGKGSKVYSFYTPRHYKENPKTYSFWLHGLPVSTAYYDKEGKLSRFIKNVYYTGIPADCPYMKTLDFLVQKESIDYVKSLPQVKAYDYYIDKEKIKEHYLTQKHVPLYDLGEGRSDYMNLYEEVYLPNIEPRTSVTVPDYSYGLLYGGATLLKERIEYCYDASEANNPVDTSDVPFIKTTYFYDNEAISVKPTRIVRADSRNQIRTKVIKRVTEMDDEADSVFVKMKERNVLSPVIKEIDLCNGLLLNESVSCYQWENADSTDCLELHQQYVYSPKDAVHYQLNDTDNGLFTFGKANYVLKNKYDYIILDGCCLPADAYTGNSRTVFVYEPVGKQAILSAEETVPTSVQAMDLRKYDKNVMSEVETYKPYYDIFKMFHDTYEKGGWGDLPGDCTEFMQSRGHAMMMEIIKQVAEKKTVANLERTMTLLDSVRANDNHHIYRFFQTYSQIFGIYPELKFPGEVLNQLFLCMIDPAIMTRRFVECLSHLTYCQIASRLGYMSLDSVRDSYPLKLHALFKGTGKVSYTIRHAGGTTVKEIILPSASYYTVRATDMDLSAYSGVDSVKLDYSGNVAYMAVVPAGISFEAVSYNPDRNVFAKFDQDGKLEVNEYDSAGRLIRVTDENGCITKEYTYCIAHD